MNKNFCLVCENKIDSFKRKELKYCSQKCYKTTRIGKKPWNYNKKNEYSYSRIIKIICKECKLEFEVKWSLRYRKFCSQYCSRLFYSKDKVSLKKRSNTMKEKIRNGTHKRWIKSRLNKEPSFPEKYFITKLDELNIEYEREKQIDRYFLDFAIDNIDLEIDGSQHECRVEEDKRRDLLLTENGWKVFRIKWKSIKTDIGRKHIESELKRFLKFLENENIKQ